MTDDHYSCDVFYATIVYNSLTNYKKSLQGVLKSTEVTTILQPKEVRSNCHRQQESTLLQHKQLK